MKQKILKLITASNNVGRTEGKFIKKTDFTMILKSKIRDSILTISVLLFQPSPAPAIIPGQEKGW